MALLPQAWHVLRAVWMSAGTALSGGGCWQGRSRAALGEVGCWGGGSGTDPTWRLAVRGGRGGVSPVAAGGASLGWAVWAPSVGAFRSRARVSVPGALRGGGGGGGETPASPASAFVQGVTGCPRQVRLPERPSVSCRVCRGSVGAAVKASLGRRGRALMGRDKSTSLTKFGAACRSLVTLRGNL